VAGVKGGRTGTGRKGTERVSSRRAPMPRPGLPESLASLVEAVRFQSYFDCLGVAHDATTTEVHEAYRRRIGEIDAARPVAGLVPEVRDALDEVGPVMDDAFEVLSDPDRRLAYRRALEAL
jgi:hypothetical protein